MNYLKNWFIQVLCICLATHPCLSEPVPGPGRVDTTITLLKNWLIQAFVIGLTAYGSQSCAAVTEPCQLRSLIPRAQVTGLSNTICANSNPATPGVATGATDETCRIPNGGTVTVAANACSSAVVLNQPTLVDRVETPGLQVDMVCRDNNILPASIGGDEIDNDVYEIACRSSFANNRCRFILDTTQIPLATLGGNTPVCNDPTANDCYIRETQSFTIPANACVKNAFNVPLNIDGMTNPPFGQTNVLTTYVCENGRLRATGASPFVTNPNVEMITCNTECVLRLALNPRTPSALPFGSCVAIVNANSPCLVMPQGSALLLGRNLCQGSQRVTLTDNNGDVVQAPAAANVRAGDSLQMTCSDTGTVTSTFTDVSPDPDVVTTQQNTYTVGCVTPAR